MEKGFTASIIIAVPFTAHALSGPGGDEFSAKGSSTLASLASPTNSVVSALNADIERGRVKDVQDVDLRGIEPTVPDKAVVFFPANQRIVANLKQEGPKG